MRLRLPKPLAGVAGFEPANGRAKIYCLTAWLHPIDNREEIGSY